MCFFTNPRKLGQKVIHNYLCGWKKKMVKVQLYFLLSLFGWVVMFKSFF